MLNTIYIPLLLGNASFVFNKIAEKKIDARASAMIIE